MKLVKIQMSKDTVLIALVITLGMFSFSIFISPAFVPDISKNDIYPVLTNMMGIFAILAGIIFLYWAFRVSKRMRVGVSRRDSIPQVSPEESDEEYIFCSECELIEGRANICRNCPKMLRNKDGSEKNENGENKKIF